MTAGAIVLSRNKPVKTGIIIKVDAGAFATWFTVLWSGGEVTVCEPHDLRAVYEKGRSSTNEGRMEDTWD